MIRRVQMFRNVEDPFSQSLIDDLLRAAKEDDCKVVKAILRYGVPVNIRNKQYETALHRATLNFKKDVEVTSLLIQSGADINIKNFYGETALHIALGRENSNPTLIKLLLDCGADVEKTDYLKNSSLHFAVVGNSCKIEVMDLLLERGAVIDAANFNGDTPLLQALRNPHCTEDVIKWFIAHGANIKVVNGIGLTVLHTVSENPNFNLGILKFLLKKKPSLNSILYKYEETPLYRAIQKCCDPAIVNFMLDAGAMIDKSTFEMGIDVCLEQETWSKKSMVNLALLVKYATLRNLDCDIDCYVKTSEPRFQSLLDFKKFCKQDVLKMNSREIFPGATFRDFLTGQKPLRFNASETEGELYDLGRIFHFMKTDRYPMYTSVVACKLDNHDISNYVRIYSNVKPELKIILDCHSVAHIVKDLSKLDVLNLILAFHSAEVCADCLS